ncbi:MAG: dihydropteroate synthase [Hyphomicrobiaceae bacterium]
MLREIYLRPLGLYAHARGATADAVWGGLRLAGGWLDFSAIEIIERNGARLERRIAGLGEFMERDWGRRALNAADMFEALVAERPRLAGLALDRPRIMGIVNVTPDSFSDGGRHATTEAAIAHAHRLVAEGADILDIGGESTRPGSDPVPLDEELARVMPVIEALAGKVDARLSIDTRKAAVMRRARAAGVDMLNDVSALMHDAEALQAVAESGLPVCLMHAQGDPKTMQDAPHYDDVLTDVFDFLEARVEAALRAGVRRDRLIVDPGIGFGKTLEHNLQLMAGLSLFHGLGVPMMLGASRKRFIGTLTSEQLAADRVTGSVAAAIAGAAQGCQILRVHDVKATRQGLDVWLASVSGAAVERTERHSDG